MKTNLRERLTRCRCFIRPKVHFAPEFSWTKDNFSISVWNHWCFWRHKLPCKQSGQCVINNECISELVWVSGGGDTKWGKGLELHSSYFKAWSIFLRKILWIFNFADQRWVLNAKMIDYRGTLRLMWFGIGKIR